MGSGSRVVYVLMDEKRYFFVSTYLRTEHVVVVRSCMIFAHDTTCLCLALVLFGCPCKLYSRISWMLARCGNMFEFIHIPEVWDLEGPCEFLSFVNINYIVFLHTNWLLYHIWISLHSLRQCFSCMLLP